MNRDYTESHSMNEKLVEVLRSIYTNPGEDYHLCLLFEGYDGF